MTLHRINVISLIRTVCILIGTGLFGLARMYYNVNNNFVIEVALEYWFPEWSDGITTRKGWEPLFHSVISTDYSHIDLCRFYLRMKLRLPPNMRPHNVRAPPNLLLKSTPLRICMCVCVQSWLKKLEDPQGWFLCTGVFLTWLGEEKYWKKIHTFDGTIT